MLLPAQHESVGELLSGGQHGEQLGPCASARHHNRIGHHNRDIVLQNRTTASPRWSDHPDQTYYGRIIDYSQEAKQLADSAANSPAPCSPPPSSSPSRVEGDSPRPSQEPSPAEEPELGSSRPPQVVVEETIPPPPVESRSRSLAREQGDLFCVPEKVSPVVVSHPHALLGRYYTVTEDVVHDMDISVTHILTTL